MIPVEMICSCLSFNPALLSLVRLLPFSYIPALAVCWSMGSGA
jgi:hypothetical protein